MKKRFTWDRIYLIVTGLIIQVFLMIPWIGVGEKRLTTLDFYLHMYDPNGPGELMFQEVQAFNLNWADADSMITVFNTHLVLLMILQVIGIVNLILAFGKKKRTFLCVIGLIVCAFNVFSIPVGPILFINYWLTKFYLFFVMLLWAVQFIGFRLIESWDEATEEFRRIQERDRLAKMEKKRRLAFEGKYSSLFYTVIRKNFRASFRVYRIFILVGSMSFSFIFAGFGMQEMLANVSNGENLARGQGLGTIIISFLFVAIALSVFLIVSVLMFYLKNHMKNYALFINLGMRSKTLYLFVGIEIAFCILISMFGGCIVGNLLLFICKSFMKRGFAADIVFANVTARTYLLTFAVSFLIYLISAMATHDIYIDTGGSASRYKDVQKEKMPGRFSPLFLSLGIIFCMAAILLFSKRERAEGISVLILFFAGLYLVIKHSMNLYLKGKKKNRQVYFAGMLKKNYFYHSFKTAFRYLFLISLLHISVLFVFSRETASSMIASDAEKMLPYDYVCMATEEDTPIFASIENENDAEVLTYPMVRVTNVDNTADLENIMTCMLPQGQHIGISQSTYEKLCENVGHTPKQFTLDDEGENVFIVYQEDESVNAHPLDYYLLDHSEPYLHIGQPVLSYDYKLREEIFQPRKVVGMERENLIGNLNQGEMENIVVFSDTYFSKIQDEWKRTNLVTGEALSEEEAIEDVTLHHWPDRLVLVNLKASSDTSDQKEVEEKLLEFEKNHAFDDKFDSAVKSLYSKEEIAGQIKSERFMHIAVSIFIMAILTIVTLLLLYMKAESEMDAKKRQQEFLQCMGMRKKERLSVIRYEIRQYLWIPLAISSIAVAVLTLIMWKIRLYTAEECLAYGKVFLVIYIIYAAIQIIGVLGLERYIVRNVEVGHGRND